MKKLVLSLIVLATSIASVAAEEVKERHWLVGLGPVVSGSLSGTGGTKFGIHLAYTKQVAERLDTRYWFDGSYNSASLGSTQATGIGYGLDIFTKDRGSDTSGIIMVDLGYGGETRQSDASILAGLGLGVEFFRRNEASARIFYKRLYNLTTTTTGGVSNYPSYDSIIVAVNF